MVNLTQMRVQLNGQEQILIQAAFVLTKIAPMAQIGDVRKIPCREIFSAGDSCLYGPCALILNCMEYVEDWSVSSFQEPFLRTLLDAVKIFVSGIKKSTFTSCIFLIPLPFHTTFHFRGCLPGCFLSARKSIKNR